jgi:putative flippase GtrA
VRDLPKNFSVRARQIASAEFVKFLLVGVGNVVLTFTVYELLLFTTSYMTAFGISAVTGLVYTTLMTIAVTFRRELTARSIGAQATWYVAYSVIFALALRAAVDHLGIPPALAPFPLLAVLTPLNFLCARLLSRKLD